MVLFHLPDIHSILNFGKELLELVEASLAQMDESHSMTLVKTMMVQSVVLHLATKQVHHYHIRKKCRLLLKLLDRGD